MKTIIHILFCLLALSSAFSRDELTIPLQPKAVLDGFVRLPELKADADHLNNRVQQMSRARAKWTAFDDALRFPCDLSKYDHLPPLVLHGERHRDPYCDAYNAKCAQKAARGECTMANEGVFWKTPETCRMDQGLMNRLGVEPTSESRFVGFDDPFVHGMSILFLADVKHDDALSENKQEEAFEARLHLIRHLTLNVHLGRVWKQFTKLAPQDADQRAIIQFMQAAIGDTNEEFSARARTLSKNHPMRNKPEAFTAILHGLLRGYAKMALSPAYQKHLAPSNLSKIVEDHISGYDTLMPWQIVAVEWRNRWIAKNIAERYCESLNEDPSAENVPFIAIVGSAHLGGLHTLLNNAKTDPRLKLTVERSMTQEDVAKRKRQQEAAPTLKTARRKFYNYLTGPETAPEVQPKRFMNYLTDPAAFQNKNERTRN